MWTSLGPCTDVSVAFRAFFYCHRRAFRASYATSGRDSRLWRAKFSRCIAHRHSTLSTGRHPAIKASSSSPVRAFHELSNSKDDREWNHVLADIVRGEHIDGGAHLGRRRAVPFCFRHPHLPRVVRYDSLGRSRRTLGVTRSFCHT